MSVHHLQRATLIGGDCLEVLRKLGPNRVDAVVTDPPYELGFMGKAWDASGIAYRVDLWREVLRVLKPGGHLLAFGGTRTYHRMTCAIEDAGFEVRDSLHWFYGTGFPKSLDVSKAIDSARVEDLEPVRRVCRAVRAAMDARGLKSADLVPFFDGCHPRLINHWAARDTDSQPNLPTLAQWVTLRRVLADRSLEALDLEVVRLNRRKGEPGDAYKAAPVIGQHDDTSPGNKLRVSMLGHEPDAVGVIKAPATDAAARWQGWGTALKPGHEPIVLARKPLEGTVAANVQKWGTGALNVDGCRLPTGDDLGNGVKASTARVGYDGGFTTTTTNPGGRWPANVLLDEHAAAELDAQSGPRKAGGSIGAHTAAAAVTDGRTVYQNHNAPRGEWVPYGDAGGASRFFYVAKPSRAERDLGCDDLPARSGGEATDRADDSAGVRNPRAGANRGGGARNHHPTVKPVELMRHLVRLVTPPGGTVLDPFTGSGTTGIAARLEGFGFLGIEREPEYITIALSRIKGAA